MTTGRWAVVVGLGASLVFGASLSTAQPQGRDPDTTRARELFERGVALMENQDWGAALVQLQASFDLHPTQVALFDMGLCYKGQRRYRAAIAAFERLLTEFADRGSAERVQLARSELQTLRTLFGTVTVRADVEGAEVLVDGAAQGTTPLDEPLEIAAGTHRIAARREGYLTDEREIAVIAGSESTVELSLRPVAEPPGPGPVTPPPPVAHPRERERRRPPPAPAPRHGLGAHWFWSAVVLSGAGVVTTAVLGTLVVIGDSDYRDSRVRLPSDRQTGRRLALLTDVSLGLSVAAAVAAVLLYGQTDFGRRADRASLRLDVASRAPGAWSLELGGSF